MPGIYIHIPFCRRKCVYCDFYSVAQTGKTDDLLNGILLEAVRNKHFFNSSPLSTLYIGGGSPGILAADKISSFVNQLGDIYDLSLLQEFTVELNPEDALPEYLETLSSSGVNRISIGIQSTHNRHLGFLGRQHNSEIALQSLKNTRNAGFTNISADIIFGIPELSQNELAESIAILAEADLTHISTYLLTAEGNTLLVRRLKEGKIRLPDEDTCSRQYNLICDTLRTYGFEHYEISNFCKPEHRSQHNSSYWNSSMYLGLGPSAHSYDGYKRYYNPPDLKKYLDAVRKNQSVSSCETLAVSEKINEYIMTRLRTSDGLNLYEFEILFGKSEVASLLKNSERFIQVGSVKNNHGIISIPERYWLISDSIISDLFV